MNMRYNTDFRLKQINIDLCGRTLRSDAIKFDPWMPPEYDQNPDNRMPPRIWRKLFSDIWALKHNANDNILWKEFQHIWAYNHNDILSWEFNELNELLSDYRRHLFTTPLITQGDRLSLHSELLRSHFGAISTVILKVPAIMPDTWCRHRGKTPAEYDAWLKNVSEFSDAWQELQPGTPDATTITTQHLWIQGWDRFTITDTHQNLIVDDSDSDLWHRELSYAAKLRSEGVLKNFLIGGKEIENHANLSTYMSRHPRAVKTCGRREAYNPKLFTSHVATADFGIRLYNVLNIASNGDCYVCSEDYHQTTVYGNIWDQSVSEVWESEARQDAIKNITQTLCTQCQYGINSESNEGYPYNDIISSHSW